MKTSIKPLLSWLFCVLCASSLGLPASAQGSISVSDVLRDFYAEKDREVERQESEREAREQRIENRMMIAEERAERRRENAERAKREERERREAEARRIREEKKRLIRESVSVESRLLDMSEISGEETILADGSVCRCEIENGQPSRGNVFFNDGSIYIGEIKDRLANSDEGHWLLRTAEGIVGFWGPARDGAPHGDGTLTFNNQIDNFAYVTFDQGEMVWISRFLLDDDGICNCDLRNGEPVKGTVRYENGRIYSGAIQNRRPNSAQGRWSFENGWVFEGPTSRGQPNGTGKLFTGDGASHVVTYRDGGLLEGTGIPVTLSDGGTCVCSFLDGEIVTGIVAYADGQMLLQGDIRDELPNTELGTWRLSDGSLFRGPIKDGTPDGYGRQNFHPDTEDFEVRYDKGNLAWVERQPIEEIENEVLPDGAVNVVRHYRGVVEPYGTSSGELYVQYELPGSLPGRKTIVSKTVQSEAFEVNAKNRTVTYSGVVVIGKSAVTVEPGALIDVINSSYAGWASPTGPIGYGIGIDFDKYTYSGFWYDGVPHGFGTLLDRNLGVVIGEFQNGVFKNAIVTSYDGGQRTAYDDVTFSDGLYQLGIGAELGRSPYLGYFKFAGDMDNTVGQLIQLDSDTIVRLRALADDLHDFELVENATFGAALFAAFSELFSSIPDASRMRNWYQVTTQGIQRFVGTNTDRVLGSSDTWHAINGAIKGLSDIEYMVVTKQIYFNIDVAARRGDGKAVLFWNKLLERFRDTRSAAQ